VKYMKVWVDLDEYLMRKIEIVDVSDNINVYLIKSIKLNTGIPDDTFKFEIPKGVEKVDLR
jgi:outer membrane lipoprotein-sorting protein